MIKREKEKVRMLKQNTIRKLQGRESVKQFSTRILKKNNLIRNPFHKKTSNPNLRKSIIEEFKKNEERKNQRGKKGINFSYNSSIENLYQTNKKIIACCVFYHSW